MANGECSMTVNKKPKEDKISGKISRQAGMITATISAHMIFGDVCISIQAHDQSDTDFYDRVQNAINFVKESQKEKENQYYG